MSDSVRDAAHEVNNRLSAILTIADLERRRSDPGSKAEAAFTTICDAVRLAATSAALLSDAGRDQRYLLALTADPDPILRELHDQCVKDGIPAVDVDTGRLLSVLTAGMLATSILELGTAYGYSALCMAKWQPETGRIWTIDPDRDRTAVARRYFERAGVADRIEIIEQPALSVLPKLRQRQFDIVFIYAIKEEYADYLALSLPHLKRSGLVIVDNLLWHHRASTPPAEGDEANTKAIRRFNEIFLAHPDLRATIVPMGDGVGIGAKIR